MRRRAPTSAVLRRLGMATPPPFVGRHEEMTAIGKALDEHVAVVVQGAVGSGKSRLALQVAARTEAQGTRPVAYVRCLPGDREIAVLARAERAMDLLPGMLAAALDREPWLLIVDDVHHLSEDGAARTLAAMLRPGAAPRGRLLVVARDMVPLRRGVARMEVALEGLDEPAARDLWAHLEQTYGPTRQGACDEALALTRGMPLALRREYARAAFGDHAWRVASLDDDARRALEAIAVVRVPVAPAGIAAMDSGIAALDVLRTLVARQLIDALDDGRFAIHDIVRDQVLAAMEPERRTALARAAAEMVAAVGRGARDARRLAWEAGDDGALGYLDAVDQVREAVLHHVTAGEPERALARLVDACEQGVRCGGGGEILALIDLLRPLAGGSRADELDRLRAGIATRHGRIAEALEIQAQAGGSALDPVTAAELAYRAGDVAGARRQLAALAQSSEVSERCRAAALLGDIELACGDARGAENLATSAFERDRAVLDDAGRARLHLTLAAAYEHMGRIGAARAALSRASSSGRLEPGLAALIEARRSACLAREGRLSEADAALAEAERAAREIDAAAVADEVRHCRALVALHRGNALEAQALLGELVALRRQRGDELGALLCEIDLGRVLVRCGELARAAELVSACASSARRRRLGSLLVVIDLVGAGIDVAEHRLATAEVELERIIGNAEASADVRAQAALLHHLVRAWQGAPVAPGELDSVHAAAPELHDDIEVERARALIMMAIGDAAGALRTVRAVAGRAERAGRAADLADALALAARLMFAGGSKQAAQAAAERAVREATACGLRTARAHAALVLAALAREAGELDVAAARVREVMTLATDAGLPVERLVAAEAGEAISGADLAGANQVRDAAAASMSEGALEVAARILGDLGLTAVRPFRVVSAGGSENLVADASPERLRMLSRSLAIDGVREVVLRDGQAIANLRRRSLLKRILFLFAGAPGRIFSKEDIVQSVWNVEYHPLRHDAALFTNIMRIRRLLGDDGTDLIRVSEDGYRFVPPKDFLYVAPATCA